MDGKSGGRLKGVTTMDMEEKLKARPQDVGDHVTFVLLSTLLNPLSGAHILEMRKEKKRRTRLAIKTDILNSLAPSNKRKTALEKNRIPEKSVDVDGVEKVKDGRDHGTCWKPGGSCAEIPFA